MSFTGSHSIPGLSTAHLIKYQYTFPSIMAANPPNPPPAQPQPRVYPAVYSGIGVNNFLSDVLTLLRAVDLSSCIPTSPSTRSLLRDARLWSVCRTPSRSALHSSPKPDESALFSQYIYFKALFPLRCAIVAMGSVLLAEKYLRSCYPYEPALGRSQTRSRCVCILI